MVDQLLTQHPWLAPFASACVGMLIGIMLCNLVRRNEQLAAEREIVRLNERLIMASEQAERQQQLLDTAQDQLSHAFKGLSADALKYNNAIFLQLARATLEKYQSGARDDLDRRQHNIEQLAKPIRERLEKFDDRLNDLEKARIGAYRELHQQMKSLLEFHLPQLHAETASLVKALRQPTTRGRWGEVQLKRVVEMAGMLEHCDFEEQVSVAGSDNRLRPDLIVHLPGGGRIVVDAKAPVDAYLNAIETDDEQVRQAELTRHAQQLRRHLTELGRKSYFQQFEFSPEFVVLFVPGEAFFSAALSQDLGLIEYGAEQNVIPSSPTTLIALLKAVAYGWRQEALAKNARLVAELGRELHDRLRTMNNHWANVGRRLDGAVDAYNKASASLDSRVMVTARRFKELEAATGDDIEPAPSLERRTRKLSSVEMDTEEA